MPNNYTRRTVVSSLAALAAASQTAGSVAGKEAEGQGHGIEQEGATLNRFATTIIGAEITGMFITEDGRFFFNVQHRTRTSTGRTNREFSAQSRE